VGGHGTASYRSYLFYYLRQFAKRLSKNKSGTAKRSFETADLILWRCGTSFSPILSSSRMLYGATVENEKINIDP